MQRAEPDWLPPVAALAYFEPPVGARLFSVGQALPEVVTRYGFRAAGLGLLINPDIGSEVLAKPQISTIPASPPGFLGLLNLRGNLVPLYELRILLGEASRPAEADTMVLVLGKGDHAVGIVIEGYPEALTALSPLSELPPLHDALQDHVSAGFVQDNMVWLEFNHGSFFDEVCSAPA